MKTLHSILYLLIICFLINERVESQATDIPVINKNKSYPEKEFEPNVDTIYVPLETNADILLGYDAHIYYVSDKRMLIVHKLQGDVFVFDMNGKALSHFNAKGGLGCTFINYVVYDEKNQEVFILDMAKRKIIVFSEEGRFKRSLQFTSGIHLSEIHNFDENSLLAFHEHRYGPLEQTKPYMFISKKDGTILSRLNITMDKANPRVLNLGTQRITKANNYSGNCKFGQEYILFNMSSDTIYLLKQDKTITPLFVQHPTVFSDPPVITSVRMKTDDYIAFTVYPYDLKQAQRDIANGYNRIHEETRNLLYEFSTGRFFELKNLNYTVEKADVPKNTSVTLIDAYFLKRRLEKGKLKGKLKDVASKINIDDNPVVMLVKLK